MNNLPIHHNSRADGFFYEKRDDLTRLAARRILKILRDQLGPFESVVDIGCGVGTWLSVAEELGAKCTRGIDGPWATTLPYKASGTFQIDTIDLEKEWKIKGNYRLGISLEVAEHLTEQAGARLIKNLCATCDVILFSAAIPGQGGVGHINEQWPLYWQEQFETCGMDFIDVIRPIIIGESSIPVWYRQNCIIFAKNSIADEYYRKMHDSRKKYAQTVLPVNILPPAPLPPLVFRPLISVYRHSKQFLLPKR